MLSTNNMPELFHPQTGPARWPVRVYRLRVEIPTVGAETRLAETFPTVRRAIGRKLFASTARRFLDAAVPLDPYVNEAGAGFSAYLSTLPELASMPFASDVARFDWAIRLARAAKVVPSIDPGRLVAVPLAERAAIALRLRPDLQLVSSAFALTRIYAARGHSRRTAAAIRTLTGHKRLIIYRAPEGISWRRVGAAEFRFLAALKAGRPLGVAHAAAHCEDPLFDLATCLAWLMLAGEIAGFELRTKFKQGVMS